MFVNQKTKVQLNTEIISKLKKLQEDILKPAVAKDGKDAVQ